MMDSCPSITLEPSNTKHKSKPKPRNPIESAIRSWSEKLPSELLEQVRLELDNLITRAPRRWVVYYPLVLLPSGSFEEEWWQPIPSTISKPRGDLWRTILEEISKREGKGKLSHLAVNAGIPLHRAVNPEGSQDGENILRTPSGLIMLFGDFGPALDPDHAPSEEDFEEAFWVSTKQNGITQIWAPRYTMFSRGNVKEKARLLDFHRQGKPLASRRTEEDLGSKVAVDLYAGIGYFVFSYVKMGMGKVIGWELNPWSVEGLRRGAIANGWSVKVIRSDERLELGIGNEKIVVVLEDNKSAAERLKLVAVTNVNHINCGLLPSSETSWEMAMEILDTDGWLHLHENVGAEDIDQRRGEIEVLLQGVLRSKQDSRTAKVEHVELVKTFAPGVWHCVFDIYICRTE